MQHLKKTFKQFWYKFGQVLCMGCKIHRFKKFELQTPLFYHLRYFHVKTTINTCLRFLYTSLLLKEDCSIIQTPQSSFQSVSFCLKTQLSGTYWLSARTFHFFSIKGFPVILVQVVLIIDSLKKEARHLYHFEAGCSKHSDYLGILQTKPI